MTDFSTKQLHYVFKKLGKSYTFALNLKHSIMLLNHIKITNTNSIIFSIIIKETIKGISMNLCWQNFFIFEILYEGNSSNIRKNTKLIIVR